MIGYTPEAEKQVDDLRIHYEKKERLEAARYWMGYSDTIPPVIVAVFYDEANIPPRV